MRASQARPGALTITGMRGFFAEALDKIIAELGVEDSVQLTGWIPRNDLLQLYALERRRSVYHPSIFEGFGMPVLEAMAAGIPVACSDIAPLREVAGDAALFFDPKNEDAIAGALDRIVNRCAAAASGSLQRVRSARASFHGSERRVKR